MHAYALISAFSLVGAWNSGPSAGRSSKSGSVSASAAGRIDWDFPADVLDEDTLRRQWRTLAATIHPDTCVDPSEGPSFQELTVAYKRRLRQCREASARKQQDRSSLLILAVPICVQMARDPLFGILFATVGALSLASDSQRHSEDVATQQMLHASQPAVLQQGRSRMAHEFLRVPAGMARIHKIFADLLHMN
mmetsp:Transcript_14906/g.24906  ORF Transcript_14906/g.24906 Transcript_14906/m.24906 type:complete len:193 (-) Transcript_14906:254-832(-)